MDNSITPPVPSSPVEWLQYAASDLQLAKMGRADSKTAPNQVAFYAQEAVKKAVRGVMLEWQLGLAKTTNAPALAELAKQRGIPWPLIQDPVETAAPQAGALNPDAPQVAWEQVDMVIQLADKIITWARQSVK